MPDAASSILTVGIEDVELTQEERDFFSEEQPAGLTLFKRNIPPKIDKTSELTKSIQDLAVDRRFLIAIDQEGGRVCRLGPPFPNKGPALMLVDGKTDSRSLKHIETYASEIGIYLKRLGINCDFAPVCDVLTNEKNDAIGDRVFGRELHQVQVRAKAFLDGLQQSGVLGCLKHFPGQGAAGVDTHKGMASISASEEELFARDIAAFEPMLEDSPMVMMSHCVYPQVSPNPASLSREWVIDILRGRLGYQGVVVSDDMLMGAIPQDVSVWQSRIVDSVKAGVDLLLVCRDISRAKAALSALREEASRCADFEARLLAASERVISLRSCLEC